MAAQDLRDVLEATGYLVRGEPAQGVYLDEDAHAKCRWRDFLPDAMWRNDAALTVYFKAAPEAPSREQIASWRREIWNQGFAPLLWVVSPDLVELHNGFDRPRSADEGGAKPLRTFQRIDATWTDLDSFAGRFAMETGQFWTNSKTINRKTSVDRQLLRDLSRLERDLVRSGMEPQDAQGLIGRSVFAQYLVDRGVVPEDELESKYGFGTLSAILRGLDPARQLFEWLQDTFNGDMFPAGSTLAPAGEHLCQVADFLDATDPISGQTSLFPYQFDVIPVELISSIYEQFTQTSATESDGDAFYTRLSLVALVLDELSEGLTGHETVLDPTCGSGVFLVEALRRLVHLRSKGGQPTRDVIRTVLREQIFGVDTSDAAARVAAFSLYLAALELDPEPPVNGSPKFDPLIGRNLLVGDFLDTGGPGDPQAIADTLGTPSEFEVIVGNPPWSYDGKTKSKALKDHRPEAPHSPRGVSLRFAFRALELSAKRCRLGLVLSAVQFFPASKTGAATVSRLLRVLRSPTLVNLSHHSNWLFRRGSMPAMVVLAGHRSSEADTITSVQIPWSPAGVRSHTFEVGRSDVLQLSTRDWQRRPELLKASFLGSRRDLALLDELIQENTDLREVLRSCGGELRNGLTFGNRSGDASHLVGFPFLTKGNLRPFRVASRLPKFSEPRAERPRSRSVYRAPLVLVEEFVDPCGRTRASVVEHDTVFTKSFYGASLPKEAVDAAHVFTAILSSSLASWFLLMTASTFGISVRRLQLRDLGRIPIPDVEAALEGRAGRRLVRLAREYRHRSLAKADWLTLDEAVFDLYGLNEADRSVARDGLFRARWQWMAGREASVAAATTEQMEDYAVTFQAAVDVWLLATARRQLRAEVLALPDSAPLRVVRFILEDRACGSGPAEVKVVRPTGSLREILDKIGERLEVPLSASIVGQREVRACGSNEVVVVKPAARRHWMAVAALNDADAVIGDSLSGPFV